MDTTLQILKAKIQSYIRSKAVATPEPGRVKAVDTAEILEDLTDYCDYLAQEVTGPPAPDGVSWYNAPGKPTLTATTVSETQSEVNNAGTIVVIPAKTITFPLAASGKKRKDAIVASYTADPPFYARVAGEEVDANAAILPTPNLNQNDLFVRWVDVTDSAIIQAPSNAVKSISVNGVTEFPDANGDVNLEIEAGGGAVPEPTPADAGKAIIANSLGEYILQAITATAGGTTEGALQYRDAAGQTTGTDLLRWLGGKLTLGSTGNPGQFEVIASESTIEAQDGQTLTLLLNNDLDNALEIKDKVTESLFFKVRTKANDEAIVTTKAHDVDALMGAPHKVRQGFAETTSAAKAYFKIPNSATDIVINMLFAGNIIKFKGEIIGIPASGTDYLTIEFDSSFVRVGSTISQIGTTGLTVKESTSSGVTAGLEVNGTADGLLIFITPNVATAYTWYLTSSYMKI